MLPVADPLIPGSEDYVITGECIPVSRYFEPETLVIKNLLYNTAGGYMAILSDTCDLTGAIDNMLQEGAAELKKAMAAANALITEGLNAIEKILRSKIIDELYNEIEGLIVNVLSGLQSAITMASNVLESIKSVIKNVIDGVKAVLCEVSVGAIKNVSPTFTAGVVALATVKNLKVTPDMDIGVVTDAVAKASGVGSVFNSATNLKSNLNSQIHRINSLGSSLCETSFRPIDNAKILKQYV